MYIVCVAACPTGVAHTYMAAESLEITGKTVGMKLKWKRRGALALRMKLRQRIWRALTRSSLLPTLRLAGKSVSMAW